MFVVLADRVEDCLGWRLVVVAENYVVSFVGRWPPAVGRALLYIPRIRTFDEIHGVSLDRRRVVIDVGRNGIQSVRARLELTLTNEDGFAVNNWLYQICADLATDRLTITWSRSSPRSCCKRQLCQSRHQLRLWKGHSKSLLCSAEKLLRPAIWCRIFPTGSRPFVYSSWRSSRMCCWSREWILEKNIFNRCWRPNKHSLILPYFLDISGSIVCEL